MTFTPKQKERFYHQKGRLPVLASQKVSNLVNTCLAYDPAERPSFRTVLRELSEFMKTSAVLLPHLIFVFLFWYLGPFIYFCICFLVTAPDLSPSETLPYTGHSVFHKRFLKMQQVLGEVSAAR